MPILSARDCLGRPLQPGDRVAVPMPDGFWIGGSVLGFSPYKAVEPEALILLSLETGQSMTALAAACRRLGSRQEVAW